jgi:hypothetical protein
MPDWKPEIRRQLAGLKLEPTCEAAIVEELAQCLDDYCAELLADGAAVRKSCTLCVEVLLTYKDIEAWRHTLVAKNLIGVVGLDSHLRN